jgi:hypothetical protein
VGNASFKVLTGAEFHIADRNSLGQFSSTKNGINETTS